MRPLECIGKKCANRRGSSVTPISSAEAVVPVTPGKDEDRPAVVTESPDHKAQTGTRHRAMLVFTTLRRQAIGAYPLRGSRAAPSPPPRTFPLPDLSLWIAPCRSALTTPSRPTTAIGRPMAGGAILPGEQAGNVACPRLLGTWSVALPASHLRTRRSGAMARPKEQETFRQIAALFLQSWTLTRFGPESAGKPSQQPMACGLRAGRLDVLQRRDFAGQLLCGHRARLRSPPRQGHFHAQLLVCAARLLCKLGYASWAVEGAWLLLASLAGSPTNRAPTSRSHQQRVR